MGECVERGGKDTCARADPLWSQNNEYFSAEKSRWLGIYKSKRHEPPTPVVEFVSLPNDMDHYVGPDISYAVEEPAISYGLSSKSTEKYRTQALQALAALGYHGISAADFHRLYPADEYEEELKVMAGVRAHFQVAYKVRYHHP